MPTDPTLQEVAEYYRDLFDTHEFLSTLSVEIESLEEGQVVLRIPFDESFSNPGYSDGTTSKPVQGGIVATAMDIAGGPAVRSMIDNPTEYFIATTNLNISYMQPTRGEFVVQADCLHAGKSLGYCYIDVRCEQPTGDMEESACALGTYRILSR